MLLISIYDSTAVTIAKSTSYASLMHLLMSTSTQSIHTLLSFYLKVLYLLTPTLKAVLVTKSLTEAELVALSDPTSLTTNELPLLDELGIYFQSAVMQSYFSSTKLSLVFVLLATDLYGG